MLNLTIKQKEFCSLFDTMKEMVLSDERRVAEARKKIFLQCIYFDKDANTLVASNGYMMLIWKVTDEGLLKALQKGRKNLFLRWVKPEDSEEGKLIELQDSVGRNPFPDYKAVLPKYTRYKKLSDVDEANSILPEYMGRSEQLLQYSIASTKSFYQRKFFDCLGRLDWDTIWYGDEQKPIPVMFKNNRLHLISVVMPIRTHAVTEYVKGN